MTKIQGGKKPTKIKALGNFPKHQQIDDGLSPGQTREF